MHAGQRLMRVAHWTEEDRDASHLYRLGHFVLAIAAIGAGAAVALARKGTSRHRQLGRTYGFLLIGVNVTALMIYGLFGRFGPFHIFAVISLITVLVGWIPARRRSPDAWIVYHAYFMSWSYVGLLAAAAAETLSRIPTARFGAW